MENIQRLISDKVSDIETQLIATRRKIYMHPELSGDERNTSRLVADKLESFGLEVQTNIGGYGVAGILKGKKEGGTTAWRADMDACAMQDIIDKPYRSKIDGIKHVCGHDAHTAIALGIAETLSSIQDYLYGTIIFLFQPFEEGGKGALRMIQEGIVDNPRPDAVYGLHVTNWGLNQTYLKAGQLTVNYGAALFGKNTLRITVKVDNDDIDISTEQNVLIHYLSRLNRYDLKCKKESQNLIYFKIEEKDTLFRNSEIRLKISYRIAQEKFTKEINKELHSILNDYQKNNNYKVTVETVELKPPVYNDEKESEKAYRYFLNHLGENAVAVKNELPPHGWDDFAYFQNEIGKGLFFFIGMANKEKGITTGMHNPNFDIDEDCLKFAVKYMSIFLYETNSGSYR